MNKPKNICIECGGKLVIEHFGSYGTVYPLKRDGEPAKQRIRRTLYEEGEYGSIVYCSKCGKVQEEKE